MHLAGMAWRNLTRTLSDRRENPQALIPFYVAFGGDPESHMESRRNPAGAGFVPCTEHAGIPQVRVFEDPWNPAGIPPVRVFEGHMESRTGHFNENNQTLGSNRPGTNMPKEATRMKDEVNRVRTVATRKSAMRIGEERLEQQKRRCPVEGCSKTPKSYSRYCSSHAERNKRLGHPVIDTTTRTREAYASCLKLGRWLRENLSETDEDRRAWMRIEDSLERLGRDPKVRMGIPTLARRNDTWKNEFKAKCLLATRLEGTAAEEVLAAFLGMTVLILDQNTVSVSAVQMEYFFNKAGGKAATRYKRRIGIDEETGRKYEWIPSNGTITQVGKLIHRAVQREHGVRWWKEAEVVIATKLPRD